MQIIKSYFSQDRNVKYQNSSIHCGESVSFTAIYNAVNIKTDPKQSKLNTRIWENKIIRLETAFTRQPQDPYSNQPPLVHLGQ